MALRALPVLGAIVLALGGVAGEAPTVGHAAAVSDGGGDAARVPVVLIVLENHDYSQIVGNRDLAPYVNCAGQYTGTGLICNGKLYTNYAGLFHPSLPNYLAMTSGSNDGCTDDDCPPNSITTSNLFHQLAAGGRKWRAYEESMRVVCELADDPNGVYVVHHNPPPYFTDLVGTGACVTSDVPYARLVISNLPDFSFVTPNLCDDMHDASVDCFQHAPGCSDIICVGDRWLARNVPPLVRAGVDVVVAFDEPRLSSPATARVMIVQLGPNVLKGSTDGHAYNHYSLLRGIEDFFGLSCLQNACGASALPINR